MHLQVNVMDADGRRDNWCSNPISPPEFVRQVSKKVHLGSRSSSTSSGSFSFEQVEQGGSMRKHSKQNSRKFCQVVAVDEDEVLRNSNNDAQAQQEPAGQMLDLYLNTGLVSPPGFLRQISKKIYYGSRKLSESSTRLSFEQLELGANRYYKSNSLSFGQVVAVHDDELLEFPMHDAQPQAPAEHLKLGLDLDAANPVQALSTTTGGSQKRSELTSEGGNGGKSRLETIILEQSWFTVYKRLFLGSFVANLICLIVATTGHFSYAKSRTTIFSVANILMSVLVRNEIFLRILFWLAVHVLGTRWIPVQIKVLVTAFLQSVGGIHSGCGMSAIMWLVYALVQSFQNVHSSSAWTLGVACITLFMLVLSCVAAFPVFRHIHHNFFERVHRFAGWTSLGLVWAYIVLSEYHTSDSQRANLVEVEIFWLTGVTSGMIVLPWLTVRRVAVETVVPPTKLNSLLHFEGGMKPGLFARISPSPFSEWHAFGIISDGHQRHTILAGAVGDYTKSLVENPPTHIWVRTFHFAGLPYLTNMYEKVLLVATGSGICVFLSFLMQPTRADVHIIWIAKNIRESYGEGISEVTRDTPAEKFTVIDTAVSGRPKTKELVVRKAMEWRAQVVIVTSNPRGTSEIVSGCKAVGIPAFGPIWDS